MARVAEKTRLNICANNKGADQPARPLVWLQIFFGHITVVEINNEIISMVMLPLPLIQDGQLSVTSGSMCASSC